MNVLKRICVLTLVLALLSGSSLAASKKKNEFVDREITPEVVQEIPETIQNLLDLAYREWVETDARDLKEVNKFTEWRGKGYKFGWCGGFITWCMLELGVPQKDHNKTEEAEVEGIVHVLDAGVGKLFTGYQKMNRITRIPQKGFIAVIGNVGHTGTTPFCHVGLVYDVQKLDEGKYRITTIEGNVPFYGDQDHKKAIHTIRMFVRDYDMNAKVQENMTLVPEEERDREESPLFSYKQSYRSTQDKKRTMYFYRFLMPWIPGEDTAE